MVLQYGRIEAGHRIVRVIGAFFNREAVPRAAQIHSEIMQAPRRFFGKPLRNGERGGNFFQKRFGGQTAKILHGPVVIHDLELIVGKKHRQHAVRLLRLRRLAASAGNRSSGGGAVMSVGNIQGCHLIELRPDGVYLRLIRDHPRGVDHAVFGGEIIFRPAGGNLFHDLV